MTGAEIVALIGSLLSAGQEIAKLAASALEAWKAGDDAKALALVDQALAKYQASIDAARAALEEAQKRVVQRIDDKFGSAK